MCSVYVGGLTDLVTKGELKKYFEKYGDVKDIKIITNSSDVSVLNVRSFNFAFVKFFDHEVKKCMMEEAFHYICNGVCEVKIADHDITEPSANTGKHKVTISVLSSLYWI